jgi:CO/xanthine dehydrogenase FAD-binding subunit
MKPAEFDYVRAGSLGEAVDALASRPGEAKVLAGGQSLVLMMNFRLATPSLLVDINRVPDLDRVERPDGGLRIGATARQADVEGDPAVQLGWPLVSEALHHVGHPQLRTRGTVVGSLVHHDPSAEMPAVALALEAQMTLAGPAGERTVLAGEFFQTYFTTEIADDEVATSVWFPAPPEGAGSAFIEIARRPGDFTMVGVAALVQTRDRDVTAARLEAAADPPRRAAR